MLLGHLRSGRRVDVVVDLAGGDPTIADLCLALDPDRPIVALVVDGRTLSPATPIDRSGLGDGCLVRRADDPDPGVAPTPMVRLVVASGLDSGRVIDLGEGEHVLGRSGDGSDGGPTIAVGDPTISRLHAELSVDGGDLEVTDLGSTNGTLVDGVLVAGAPVPLPVGSVLRCGSTRLERIEPRPPAPTRSAGSQPPPHPHHRGPGPEVADRGRRIEVPSPPGPPPGVTPVGVVALLGSLALAGVLVVVLGSWMYAAFAVLGPLLMLATALDSRSRSRRARRTSRRRWARELEAFETEVLRRREEARIEAERLHPGAAAARAAATAGPGGIEPGAGTWSMRSDHPSANTVRLGTGAPRWSAPVEPGGADASADVQAILDRHGRIPGGPTTITLGPGRPVVLVPAPSAGGDATEAARRVARSLVVQAAVLHGPADLLMATMAAPETAAGWRWMAWLPHVVGAGSERMVAGDGPGSARLAEMLDRDGEGGGPVTVVVIDDPHGLDGRRSSGRRVLRAAGRAKGRLAAVAILGGGARVPAGCLAVSVDSTGRARVLEESSGDAGDDVVRADGMAVDVAEAVARALARWEDPEAVDSGRGLPDHVALTSLLPVDPPAPDAIAARWRSGGRAARPVIALGVGSDGALSLDLAADGPHALIAGTTGSGKSELLRSLVVSLAISCSPDDLNLVLIDFKGGSAFDACVDLPHTTGLVTDLDGPLAARALRCLEAELRHREGRLRELGVEDLAAWRASAPVDAEPLPRLVVVIDEFATLAGELPDFVTSLVGIAQRGRSLGVHLVLATQRPSGSIGEDIRANTAIRIALRVEDRAESIDVIDAPDAAGIPRGRPGRAVARLGPSDLRSVQTPYTGGRSLADGGSGGVTVRRLDSATFGTVPAVRDAGEGNDLEVLVGRIRSAWEMAGGRAPRTPWPPPLPTSIAWAPLRVPGGAAGAAPELVVGVADEPDRQAMGRWGWRPDDGPILAVGVPGSGTSTTLMTLVLSACAVWEPSECHIHVVDAGAGALAPLAGLPQVGAVIGIHEAERRRRLLSELVAEVRSRRADPSRPGPRRLLVVDCLGSLFDLLTGEEDGAAQHLEEIVSDGTAVRVHVALAAEGPTRIPHRIGAACRRRLIHHLGDPSALPALGVPKGLLGSLVPGRAVDPDGPDGPLLVQMAHPSGGAAAEVARSAARGAVAGRTGHGPGSPVDPGSPPDVGGGPSPVRVLPARVDAASLRSVGAAAAVHGDGSVHIPFGIADRGLQVAGLTLLPGGHAIVVGPPRSGRSTTLAAIAGVLDAAGVRVVFVGGSGGVRGGTGTGEAAETEVLHVAHDDPELETMVGVEDPTVILIDDADLIPAGHEVLRAVCGDRRPQRHVIAAARPDRVRTGYGHWVREATVDRMGVLLAPDPDLDGELLGVRLPRRTPVPPRVGLAWSTGDPGGWVQVAVPDDPVEDLPCVS